MHQWSFREGRREETISTVYSPEGAFIGSMRTNRIETSLQAYRDTTSLELGPQARAGFNARYKNGSKSGSHCVACKNFYTALPSLATALISALGAKTESSASPFIFNPEKKSLLSIVLLIPNC